MKRRPFVHTTLATSHEQDFMTGTSGIDSSGLADNGVRPLWRHIQEDINGKATSKPLKSRKASAKLG
jgi:hypothetical protein|tara:strand:+ start:9365 stop:9565 length:201 start_codon:yes stop_codon:yes gene_type:complete